MRRHYTLILSAITAALSLFCSCTLETSDNGDLDGFWHLERVDTIATGGSCDMSERVVFWAVQKNLMTVIDYDNDIWGYIMRFNHNGNDLRIYEPRENKQQENDPKIEDVSELAPYGINALDETFAIEHLNSNNMRLSTEELRLYFQKM